MAADPKVSFGARLERRAFREYLRRLQRRGRGVTVDAALAWVVGRQARYDAKPKGLGRA